MLKTMCLLVVLLCGDVWRARVWNALSGIREWLWACEVPCNPYWPCLWLAVEAKAISFVIVFVWLAQSVEPSEW